MSWNAKAARLLATRLDNDFVVVDAIKPDCQAAAESEMRVHLEAILDVQGSGLPRLQWTRSQREVATTHTLATTTKPLD